MKSMYRGWLVLLGGLTLFFLAACDVEPSPYSLSLSIDGAGSVTPDVGTTFYSTATRVSLEATPAEGWLFSHWEGPVEVRNQRETGVVVDGSLFVQAVFVEGPLLDFFVVTVAIEGAGQTSPALGVHTYAKDETVEIYAQPAVGFEFSRWLGEVVDPYAAETVALSNLTQTVTAVFTEIVEMRFYEDADLNKPLQSLDLGLWLDGYAGPVTTVYLYSPSFDDVEVTRLEVMGEGAHLFKVEVDLGILPALGVLPVYVRYRGELDPGELGLKQATLEVEGTLGIQTLDLRAEPTVDDVWALHSLVAPEITVERILALLDIFEQRTYLEAQLAQGILNVHLFALGQGYDTEAVAMKAYQALQASMIDSDLRVAYQAVASGFVASILGANGGSYIDTMQSLFETIDQESTSWLALYWKGVTYLRTSEGIMDNIFSRIFYGNRVNNIWVPSGMAALTQVMAQYEQASLDDTMIFNGFDYDRHRMPVPDDIYQDLLTVPYFN